LAERETNEKETRGKAHHNFEPEVSAGKGCRNGATMISGEEVVKVARGREQRTMLKFAGMRVQR